jgi:hypothetical protein
MRGDKSHTATLPTRGANALATKPKPHPKSSTRVREWTGPRPTTWQHTHPIARGTANRRPQDLPNTRSSSSLIQVFGLRDCTAFFASPMTVRLSSLRQHSGTIKSKTDNVRQRVPVSHCSSSRNPIYDWPEYHMSRYLSQQHYCCGLWLQPGGLRFWSMTQMDLHCCSRK